MHLLTLQASGVKATADALISSHQALLSNISSALVNSSIQLSNVMDLQDSMEGLLGDANGSRSVAMDAVARADETLRDADNTLKVLQGMRQYLLVLFASYSFFVRVHCRSFRYISVYLYFTTNVVWNNKGK